MYNSSHIYVFREPTTWKIVTAWRKTVCMASLDMLQLYNKSADSESSGGRQLSWNRPLARSVHLVLFVSSGITVKIIDQLSLNTVRISAPRADHWSAGTLTSQETRMHWEELLEHAETTETQIHSCLSLNSSNIF